MEYMCTIENGVLLKKGNARKYPKCHDREKERERKCENKYKCPVNCCFVLCVQFTLNFLSWRIRIRTQKVHFSNSQSLSLEIQF